MNDKLIPDFPRSPGFTSWRPKQRESVGYIVEMPAGEAVALDAPTGTGKSLTVVEAALALREQNSEARSVILTGTKTLQDQYTTDFPDLLDFRGKGNYPCPLLESVGLEDEGPRPCNSGWLLLTDPEADPEDEDGVCPVRKVGECPYYRKRREFLEPGSITITNYANYLAIKPIQKKEPEFLACDEGHNIPSMIEGLSSLAMTEFQLKRIFEESVVLPKNERTVPELFGAFLDPKQSDQWDDWLPIFQKLLSFLSDEMNWYSQQDRRDLERPALRRWSAISDIHSKADMAGRFGGMLPAFEKDAVSRREKDPAKWTGHWTFAPILPGVQAPHLLYGQSDRVLVMSATLPKHVLPQIGLSRPLREGSDARVRAAEYVSMPSLFPVENSPICYGYPQALPLTAEFTAKDERNPDAVRKWVDNAVDAPLRYAKAEGLRCLVIVSSHNQVRLIQENSRMARELFFHIWQPGKDKADVLADFQAKEGWAGLVAATDIAEGYSFAGDQVRCTILAKLPLVWPTRTPMYAARSAIIKDYCSQEMALWLAQAVGRGTRSATDTNLVIITDNRKQGWVGQVERFLPPHVQKQLTTKFPGEDL